MNKFWVLLLLLATPVLGQGLVFQGDSGLAGRQTNTTGTGFGASLRALQDRTPEVVQASRIITLPRDASGHFYADMVVNGVTIEFLVDTGATGIAMSRKDARAAGIDVLFLKYTLQAQTANGIVKMAPVHLRSVALGQTKLYDFPAHVLEGELQGSLLGMTFLSQFSEIEILAGEMRLHP